MHNNFTNTLYSYCYVLADLRYLHSFPTRRSSDLGLPAWAAAATTLPSRNEQLSSAMGYYAEAFDLRNATGAVECLDRKSTRLNSSHLGISYAVFCLKKKNNEIGVFKDDASIIQVT